MLMMQNNTSPNTLQEYNFDDKVKFTLSDYQLSEKIDNKQQIVYLANAIPKYDSIKISFTLELNSTALINVSQYYKRNV